MHMFFQLQPRPVLGMVLTTLPAAVAASLWPPCQRQWQAIVYALEDTQALLTTQLRVQEQQHLQAVALRHALRQSHVAAQGQATEHARVLGLALAQAQLHALAMAQAVTQQHATAQTVQQATSNGVHVIAQAHRLALRLVLAWQHLDLLASAPVQGQSPVPTMLELMQQIQVSVQQAQRAHVVAHTEQIQASQARQKRHARRAISEPQAPVSTAPEQQGHTPAPTSQQPTEVRVKREREDDAPTGDMLTRST